MQDNANQKRFQSYYDRFVEIDKDGIDYDFTLKCFYGILSFIIEEEEICKEEKLEMINALYKAFEAYKKDYVFKEGGFLG